MPCANRYASGRFVNTALESREYSGGFDPSNIRAHISNFLRRRRSLSQEGLDRVLAAQSLSIGQLMEQQPAQEGLELSAAAATAESTLAIPVVSPAAAMDEPVIRSAAVIETVYVAGSRLDGNRSQPAPRTAHWQRFVAIRADGAQAAAMEPVIPAGATVVLDRHYNSLATWRAHQRNLYAVRTGAGLGGGSGATLVLRYVDLDAGTLILRPLSADFPVQLLALGPRESPADWIVGRVCLVLAEL